MAQHMDWSEVESLDPARGESAMDLFGILWRRKWIVACVLVISLALGYLYFLQATPIFRSVAQVLLIKRDLAPAVTSADSRRTTGNGYEDTLSTHMILICSPAIVQKAVEKYHLNSLSSLKGGDAMNGVLGGLRAARAGDRNTPDPNVMELWYEGIDPRDCSAVLSAIVKSYQDFLGDTYQVNSEETWQLISQAKDQLNKALLEKEAAYRQFRQDSQLLFLKGQAANPHESLMQTFDAARAGVLVEASQIKARIDAIQNAIKQGGNREALNLLVHNARSQSGDAKGGGISDALEERLSTALLEKEELMEQFGPEHPHVKSLEKRIALLRERIGSTRTLPEGAETSDFLTVYVDSLRQELALSEDKLHRFDEQFEQERKAAKALATSQLQDEQYKADIDRTKHLYESVVKRLDEINLLKDYSGGITAQLISQPSLGALVRPRLSMALTMAGLLGVVVGFGLAYLVDAADKSFRSPDEIRRQLGLPVVAHIPVIDIPRKLKSLEGEESNALSPILCTYYQPKSRPAEAYRAVRTALYFSAHGEGHKVIQVTSPNPGDGKTTLAANLAVSMANSGKRVLLVEADFRRPRVHKYFALDNTVGVSSIITGEADIPDVIKQTAVKNLWAMPCGPRPHNPADLLTSPRFKELIDAVREQHDFIIIDTPPILAVTDSSVVAPRVDAVLLVVRLTKHARDASSRATEVLGALGARILGVVVNGIGKGSGYGGYSGYRYGYRYSGGRGYNYRYNGYGYSYGYGSSGGREGGNLYYSEDDADARRRALPAPKDGPNG